MSIPRPLRGKIQSLRDEYTFLRLSDSGEALLSSIDGGETPEEVYNSSAIGNCPLTLDETVKVLRGIETVRRVPVRGALEAKNLARVIARGRGAAQKEPRTAEPLTVELILLLHGMLMSGIDDNGAGRFRRRGGFERAGDRRAAHPEHIEEMVSQDIIFYSGDMSGYFLEKIARFHLKFEAIRPFSSGGGRIGREIINLQLLELGFPRIIIRAADKHAYFRAFDEYGESGKTKGMERILSLALIEAMSGRIARLKGEKVVRLSDYIKKRKLSAPAVTNAARRQTIPAFREAGVWMIGDGYERKG